MTKATAFALAFALCVASVMLHAQSNTVNSGATLPTGCVSGSVYITTVTPTFYLCAPANTWTAVTWNGAIPAGSIIFIAAGSCPSGYAEVSALNGRMVRGTTAAGGNVGGTGGSDTITPTGTNAAPALTMNSYTPTGTNGTGTVTPLGTVAWPAGVPTFTGAALAAHFHELPWQIPSTTTIRQIAVATFGTGTSRAATAVSAAGVANTTAAAVALSESKTAGTPAGTVAWPAGVPTLAGSSSVTSAPTFTGQAATLTGTVAAPAFTGTQFDNRAAYINLIGCQKS